MRASRGEIKIEDILRAADINFKEEYSFPDLVSSSGRLKEEYLDIWYIYIHINKKNQKVYIGQTKQKPEQRWRRNGSGYKDSPKFWGAIQKYGWDNFKHEIIEECFTQQQANEREKYWIKKYNSTDDAYGYNILVGGNLSSEQWNIPGYREKISKSFSEARKRDWSNPAFKEKAEKALIDGIHRAWGNPEWREKRVSNIMGEKNSNAKAVKNLETGIIFTTIKEAAQWAGLKSVSGIGQCCKGKRKTSGKHPETGNSLHWEYVTKEVSKNEGV